MTRKNKYRDTTQGKIEPEVIGLILGLFFAYLEYFLDLRPKLVAVGLYQLGFIDCIIVVFSILLLFGVLKNNLNKYKK